jgi:hypothetical protein
MLKEMQNHDGSPSTGEKIMKKLLAVAVMAVLLCLVVSGNAFAGSWELTGRDRCVDNGGGSVTDNGIGLMWQQQLDVLGCSHELCLQSFFGLSKKLFTIAAMAAL